MPSSLWPDRLDSAKGAQRSAEVRRAKAEALRETLRDKLARKLEEHADEVVAAYLARDQVG